MGALRSGRGAARVRRGPRALAGGVKRERGGKRGACERLSGPGALGLAGLGRGKGEWRSGPESGLAEALAWARAGLGRAGEGKEGVGRGFGWARLGLGFWV